MAEDTEGELIVRLGITELRAIATRALASGDHRSRALLAEQLEQEEMREHD